MWKQSVAVCFYACTVQAWFTFLHFVTEQKDFIPSFAASRVAVDAADLQLSCVWGACKTQKVIMCKQIQHQGCRLTPDAFYMQRNLGRDWQVNTTQLRQPNNSIFFQVNAQEAVIYSCFLITPLLFIQKYDSKIESETKMVTIFTHSAANLFRQWKWLFRPVLVNTFRLTKKVLMQRGTKSVLKSVN